MEIPFFDCSSPPCVPARIRRRLTESKTSYSTVEEIEAKLRNADLRRQVLCYFSSPQQCYVDDKHVKNLKGIEVTMNEVKIVWNEDVKKPTDRTMQEVVDKFTCNDEVLAIRNVFFADVEK
ncbi:O-fucosyltransferase family protein [Artemisia annua]|uniref:O-fucosyltransferase family protein n=1 Tax=Artemisia annua TaxID=35608 RepID=A0A2U1KHM1_ARTAN|nr:O-fucosyltransferase family protein [Artemisia annua]